MLEQIHPEGLNQNLSCGLHFGLLNDRGALQDALNTVLQRHNILRSEVHSLDGVPSQVVTQQHSVNLDVVDLRHRTGPERELPRRAREATQRRFDLEHGPLLQATLFQLTDAEHVLLLVTHRILCDEASLKILVSEIASGYQASLRRLAEPEGAPPVQYHEVSQVTPSAEHISFWKKLLEGAPGSLELPTDRQRPAVQTFRCETQRMWMDAPQLDELRALGERHEADIFAVLLTAFNVLLSRYSRQSDLVVGTRVSGRGPHELESVVGPFETMLPLRADLSGDPSFGDLLVRVRETVRESFSHRDVRFEILIKQLHLERDLSRHPVFQAVFSMQDAGSTPTFSGAQDVGLFEIDGPSGQFDFSVDFEAKENRLEGRFSYNPDLFDKATIGRMMGHFNVLLHAAAKDPSIKVSRLPLLTEAERQRLLVEWNSTQVSHPTNIPLHKFIEEQVERTPESTAVIFETERLTYRQLNSRANKLARYLRKNAVGPDVLVGVCAERSVELVVALLAILKAGGAYVPFDSEYPKDRLESMLQDADPGVMLSQEHLLDRLPTAAGVVFCLDRDWPSVQAESAENLPATVGGKNLAYVIYTSGSTGKPKGVPNVHEGIVNRLLWMQDMYKLTGKDRVLQKTPFSFDVSVWEFFWPLMTGATLVVARPGGHRDPAYLIELIAGLDITTLHFVPSMLGIFVEAPGVERCRSVRQVFASGEALPFELQQRFFERSRAELHNLYGPTEAAVDVTYWACKPDSEQAIVPIGRPIANTQIYILDEHLQPVPIGVAGELHIGGIGLARGYLNRPDLTAQKFIRDPFSQDASARLYKTGDLARFLKDGNIEYLGRIDHQVKLHGFRIELGEIEAVLGECAGVRQAVVVVREDKSGDKRLVGYLIPASAEKLDIDRVRKQLHNRLPEYMVPSRFVLMEAFPMTTSGKVDRKSLPAPQIERGPTASIVAPRNEMESRVASVFAEVLGLPFVGATDNFFDLGGHSLLAARLLSRIHEMTGRQIPLSALFRGATVAALSQLIEQETEVSRDPVVLEIQHGDETRLPFFAIVPPGEESLGYAMLARHMGPDQTVYKIQGHAPVVEGTRPYSKEEMRELTNDYVAAIRSVRPHGPYCLGGLCDGTHIAERMVLGLEGQGEEVGLFAIFDTWVMQNSQIRWLWQVDYYRQRLRKMKGMKLGEKLASYKRVAENKVELLRGKQTPRPGWIETYWPKDFTPSRFRAPVVLFKRPKQQFYYINDPKMGWGQRSQGGVEIHEVEFHHGEILREPHVRQFGRELAKCMARLNQDPTRLKLHAS